MDLVTDVYRVTDRFPKREVYSLTDQFRRAAVSVPSNIAEGQSHYSKAEFCHFHRHSSGSLAEAETQLLIAERLEYTGHDQAQMPLQQIIEVAKLLNGLIHSLKKGFWVLTTGNWVLLTT